MKSNFRFETADYLRGVASVRNYIKNGIPQQNLAGWTQYKNTTPGPLPEITPGGTPDANFQFYQNNAPSYVAADSDFGISKLVSLNAQGNGVYYNFTIDPADAAKQMQISMQYLPSVISTGDLVVYIADLDKGVLIQPVSNVLQGGSPVNALDYFATFQTNSISTHYRLYIHCATTNATGWSAFINEIIVSRTSQLAAGAVTDWIPFTPTGSFVSNTTYSGQWRRVGGDMEVFYKLNFSGAPTATGLSLNLPTGYSIDLSELNSPTAFTASFGYGIATDSSVNGYNLFSRNNGTATAFEVMCENVASTYGIQTTVSDTAPFSFNTGDELTFNAKFPIVGWGSSQIISAIDDRRVVSARASRSGAQSTANATQTTVIFDVTDFDTHAAYNPASGQYNAPVPGYYEFDAYVEFAQSSVGQRAISVLKNGSIIAEIANTTVNSAATPQRIGGSDKIYLNAGDLLEFQAFQASGGALDIGGDGVIYTHFSINRVDGPITPLSGEQVSARYYIGSNGSLPNNAYTAISTYTLDYDTHNAFTPTTGVMTAPIAGVYEFYSLGQFDGGSSSSYSEVALLNGATTHVLGRMQLNPAFQNKISGSIQLKLNAGAQITFQYLINNGSGGNVYAGNDVSWISFKLVK